MKNLEAVEPKMFMFDARNPCRVCTWPPPGQGSSLWLDSADPGNQVRADSRETSSHLKILFTFKGLHKKGRNQTSVK